MKPVRALDRGLQVLEAIQRMGEASLNALHLETGLDRATIMRMLKTLEARGYARRTLGSARYRTSIRVQTFARPGDGASILAEVAAPFLDRLCQEIIWPSDIAHYTDGVMEIVETSRLRSPILLNRLMLGTQVDLLRSALGQICLAVAAPEERQRMVAAYSAITLPGNKLAPARIAAIIEEARQRGYGVRFTGYFSEGLGSTLPLSAIAVPILAHGRVAGALNVVWVAKAGGLADIEKQCLGPLRDTARAIAVTLPADAVAGKPLAAEQA